MYSNYSRGLFFKLVIQYIRANNMSYYCEPCNTAIVGNMNKALGLGHLQEMLVSFSTIIDKWNLIDEENFKAFLVYTHKKKHKGAEINKLSLHRINMPHDCIDYDFIPVESKKRDHVVSLELKVPFLENRVKSLELAKEIAQDPISLLMHVRERDFDKQ